MPTSTEINISHLRHALDELYNKFNRREYVHPDPLIFLYDYNDIRDREIAGLIASSLAYGRVAQILKSVKLILDKIDKPSDFVKSESDRSIKSAFRDFKHRFTTGDEISSLLIGVKKTVERYGSLESCFKNGLKKTDDSTVNALESFVAELRNGACCQRSSVLPCPSDGSACKRWNLYLKWMVRRDDVDPGGWRIPKSKLIVPIDIHMHRISLEMGLTKRKQADMKTALEVTNAFRMISPDDPAKYDFVLTRRGISPTDDMVKKFDELGLMV